MKYLKSNSDNKNITEYGNNKRNNNNHDKGFNDRNYDNSDHENSSNNDCLWLQNTRWSSNRQ